MPLLEIKSVRGIASLRLRIPMSDVEMSITDSLKTEYYPPETQDLIRFTDEENSCRMLS